jgi:hypothetical protein
LGFNEALKKFIDDEVAAEANTTSEQVSNLTSTSNTTGSGTVYSINANAGTGPPTMNPDGSPIPPGLSITVLMDDGTFQVGLPGPRQLQKGEVCTIVGGRVFN